MTATDNLQQLKWNMVCKSKTSNLYLLGSKIWLKLFHDNDESVEKKRENTGISEKNNGGYRGFLEN